jgi:hypothetical protein
MIIVHIQVRVFYLPPFLLRFENIGVIWSMLLHSEGTVQSVKASSSLVALSTITIQRSGLQGAMIIVHIQVRVFYLPPFLWRFENIGVICIMMLHSEGTVQIKKASSSLVVSSTITIQTSGLQGAMIIVHIWVRVFYLTPFLWKFENIGVILSILLYSEETVLSVKTSKLLGASSTTTIWTTRLQGTIIRLHIGDMIAYYHPTLCEFENIGVYSGL